MTTHRQRARAILWCFSLFLLCAAAQTFVCPFTLCACFCSIMLLSFHVALLRTHTHMHPNDTVDDRQEFSKPSKWNDKNMHHVLHVRSKNQKKKSCAYIFVVFLFRRIFLLRSNFSIRFFLALFKLEWRIKKSHSERLTLSWLLLVHDWSKWKCLIGGAKVKLIVFYFDDSNEGWAEKNC